MPELPEVETVVRGLRPAVQGKTFTGHRVFDEKLSHLRDFCFQGQQVIGVRRIGKHIVIALSGEPRSESYLVIHLRMSGRLFWLPDSERIRVPGEEPQSFSVDDAESTFARMPYVHTVSLKPKHLRIRFSSAQGDLLFFDPRRFGTLEILSSLSSLEDQGLDPMGESFNEERLSALLSKSSQPIKPWLLRQDRVLGIGNIYASEILFRAGISPFSLAGSLKRKQIASLRESVRFILETAIENAGTTFSDFQTADGAIGGHQEFLSVYERAGQPCRKCGLLIARVVQAGRSTYYCKNCQR